MAHLNTPKTLAPGAYWYVVPSKAPEICAKREGEDFVRFTNGSRQSWARDGERFVGPLAEPTDANRIGAPVARVTAALRLEWTIPADECHGLQGSTLCVQS